MPFVLLVVLASLFGSSAALRAESVGLVGDAWDFGNRWLQRFILGAAGWLTILVIVGGIGPWGTFTVGFFSVVFGVLLGIVALLAAIVFLTSAIGARRWIVPACCSIVAAVSFTMVSMQGSEFTVFNGPAVALVLGFGPTIAFIVAWSRQPMLLVLPSAVNAAASGVEQALGSIPLPKKYKSQVKLPRVPETKRFLRPLGIFAVLSLSIGIYLYFVPTWKDRMLLVVLVALGAIVSWLMVLDMAKKFQKVVRFAMTIVTIVLCLGGRPQAAETISSQWDKLSGKPSSESGENSGYNSKAICLANGAPLGDVSQDAGGDASAAQFNNLLGIKFFSPVARLGAANGIDVADSGARAGDGGTWAQFSSPESSLLMGKLMLTELKDATDAYVYRNLTLDAAARKWSNGGYGGEILAGSGLDPERTVESLSPTELDQVVGLMRHRETGDRPITHVAIDRVVGGDGGVRSKNDHSLERVSQFDVELHDGCFGDWVRVPRFWQNWEKQFVSSEPGNHVGFWYDGEPKSFGPYGPNNIPEINYPPTAATGDNQARWRLQGKGVIRYIRTK